MLLLLTLTFALSRPAPVRADELDARIEELQTAIDRADTAATDRATPAYLSNMPLARLKLRKAQACARAAFGDATSVRREVEDGLAALEQLKAGRTAFEGRTGHLERAYVSRNDDTAQPYYVYVPENYTRDKKWPLITFLHGYVPTTSITNPWLLTEEQEREGARNGAIVLTPYGRRNTDFQGVGEVDVLRAIEEAERFYSVDADRIYLCGPSMGGYGTWTISLRYPGLFAACAPLSGQTDMFVWWPWPHLTAPRFKQFLGEWDNPIDLAPNAAGQHYFLQHGELDRRPLIPVEQSHMILWEMNRLGTPIEYFEHPNADHFIYWGMLCFEKAFSWLVQHRLDHWPQHVRIKSYSYRYDTAFWLRVLEYRKWGQPGTVDATVEPKANRIALTTENVARVELKLSPELVDLKRPVTVAAEGREVFKGAVTGEQLTVEVAPPLTPPKPGAARKRRGLSGPVEDVFNGPFVLVAGTGGTPGDQRALAERAATWRKEWDAFADGLPPAVSDTEVTDDLMASHNLVLFGTPETNQVLAQVAARLPIQIADHKFTLGGHTYSGPDLGLVCCTPNPLHPDRYLLIYSGETHGRYLGINHKHDLLPDYFIFSTDSHSPYDDSDRHLCAGFFDLNWEFAPDLMEGEEAERPGARYFGSADTIRDKTLKKPQLSLINGYDTPLRLRVNETAEVSIPAGETFTREVEPGRHLLTAICPDGVTRTEARLMVPEFRYQWRLPMLPVGWP